MISLFSHLPLGCFFSGLSLALCYKALPWVSLTSLLLCSIIFMFLNISCSCTHVWTMVNSQEGLFRTICIVRSHVLIARLAIELSSISQGEKLQKLLSCLLLKQFHVQKSAPCVCEDCSTMRQAGGDHSSRTRHIPAELSMGRCLYRGWDDLRSQRPWMPSVQEGLWNLQGLPGRRVGEDGRRQHQAWGGIPDMI